MTRTVRDNHPYRSSLTFKKFALKDKLVFELRALFHFVEMAEKVLRCFKEVAFFDVGVGGEGAEAAPGEDHITGFHVIPGMA